ncbi:hypothetical protein KI387_026143 [Taxus chinensis]|uniref:C2H2-type domain-containing protein n=1 Tax=Taxus chinensis TaxID=29808 RepID=A0AA38FVU5_TAXCH|nr:hypothetical protein KI387_026143 [Taxus chinensis]
MDDPHRKWTCEKCGKSFLSYTSHNRHQKKHGKRMYLIFSAFVLHNFANLFLTRGRKIADGKSKRDVTGLPYRKRKGPVPDEKRQKPHTRSAGPPVDPQFYLRKSREKSTESTATSPQAKPAIGLAEDHSGRVPDDRTPTFHQFFPLPDQDGKAGGEDN